MSSLLHGKSPALTLAALAALVAVPAQSQLKWDGCTDFSNAELKKTLLVARSSSGATAGVTAVDASLNEPTKVAAAKSGEVFIAERGGKVKVWKAGALTVAGTIATFTSGKNGMPDGSDNENGLHGMVLDPDFGTTRWIYLYYTSASENAMNISRFTVTAGNTLDMGSEKILLKVPIQKNTCCHTGGGMEFDLQGNLYITIGNNTKNPSDAFAANAYVDENSVDADDQGHAANTNDLRGKLLRIKPKADGTYEVPDGNLFPKGKDSTKAEIWAMGMRNPYSIALDKYRGWVAWGDIGPDDGLSYSEEWNLLTKPGNAGWPYFVGPNRVFRLSKNPAAPVNTSKNNTGLTNLPPAVGAIIGTQQSCAITGPIYTYDGSNPSTTKLPPHFDKKWLVSDWTKGTLDAITLSAAGDAVVTRTTILGSKGLKGPMDIRLGPDGALYVAEYGNTPIWFTNDGSTAIAKLEYTGECRPTTPVPSAVASKDKVPQGMLLGGINLGLRRDVALPAEAKGLRLYDIRGRMAWEYRKSHSAEASVAVPAEIGNGILRIQYLR